MAVDHLEIDYHLTPKGWIPGNSRLFGKLHGNGELLPPPDRVLTVRERTYQRSQYSSESISFNECWRAIDASKKIAALKQRFPLQGYC